MAINNAIRFIINSFRSAWRVLSESLFVVTATIISKEKLFAESNLKLLFTTRPGLPFGVRSSRKQRKLSAELGSEFAQKTVAGEFGAHEQLSVHLPLAQPLIYIFSLFGSAD